MILLNFFRNAKKFEAYCKIFSLPESNPNMKNSTIFRFAIVVQCTNFNQKPIFKQKEYVTVVVHDKANFITKMHGSLIKQEINESIYVDHDKLK